MTAGRPTKYDHKIQKLADEYIDGGYETCGDVVPTAAGLACEIGVSKATLYVWSKGNQKFLDTLNRLQGVQERKLTAGGLSNSYNAAITKLMLANHGYSEKVQQDNISTDGSMSPKGGADAILEALGRKYATE